MTPTDSDSENPYQSPMSAAFTPQYSGNAEAHRTTIKKFREQVHALGAFWIIIGSVALFAAGFLAFNGQSSLASEEERISSFVLLSLLFAIGAAWMVLGICTCLKQMWAVYVGLVLSYLSILGQLVRFNLCGLIIFGAVVLQAHRVIGWAGKLRAAGIPLDSKP